MATFNLSLKYKNLLNRSVIFMMNLSACGVLLLLDGFSSKPFSEKGLDHHHSTKKCGISIYFSSFL